jgi:hypothetical protein
MSLFGLSTGTKSEFRIFKENKLNFLSLVPVPNSKNATFSPLVPVLSPQEIEEKNSKKRFLGFLYRIKNFQNFFGLIWYLVLPPKFFFLN